jgi:hypothetical protein
MIYSSSPCHKNEARKFHLTPSNTTLHLFRTSYSMQSSVDQILCGDHLSSHSLLPRQLCPMDNELLYHHQMFQPVVGLERYSPDLLHPCLELFHHACCGDLVLQHEMTQNVYISAMTHSTTAAVFHIFFLFSTPKAMEISRAFTRRGGTGSTYQ